MSRVQPLHAFHRRDRGAADGSDEVVTDARRYERPAILNAARDADPERRAEILSCPVHPRRRVDGHTKSCPGRRPALRGRS